MKEVFSDELINRYSKKIFGFCLSKTKNVFDAEDLSQEILMNLYLALDKEQVINNLEGFIYKLCFYTWSNYVRKNIKYWRVEKSDLLSSVKDETSVESKDFINEIRKRIAYLAGTNQQIITMYYYDNIKLVDIAKKLNINENTVRTNLNRTKTKIKEKIMMDNNLHYKPILLNISHNGNMGTYENLTNLLGQNILYVCYKEPKTIEEIAEEVQVASCYLEEYLKQYLFHDWMTLNKNKYQTNFFISNYEFNVAATKYTMNNIENIAIPIYNTCLMNFDRFKDILGNITFSDESLMWFFTGYFSQYLWGKFKEDYVKKNINTNFMIRKDGYTYALFGQLGENVNIEDEKFRKYYINTKGMLTNRLYGRIYRGLTISEVNRYSDLKSITHGHYSSLYDSYELELVYNIIKNDLIPNDKEKNILSQYIKEEVITIVDGKPKWNVIFMEKDVAENFYKLLDKMIVEIDEKILIKYLLGSKEVYKQYIPKHIAKEMIDYYCTDVTITSPTLYYLFDNECLKMPKRKECKTSSEWFYIYE